MKLLELHCDYIEYKPGKKALKSAPELSEEEKAGARMEEALAVFTTFEKGDDESVADQAAEQVKKNFGEVKAQAVMVYPYAHLSHDLADPATATRLLEYFYEKVLEFAPESKKSVFGYYKAFALKCKGHPLAELSKSFHKTAEELGEKKEFKKECKEELKAADSASLKAEEKAKRRFLVLTPEGRMVGAQEFDYGEWKNLKKFAGYEISKDRVYAEEPPHIQMMKDHGLCQYEPGSDAGNFRWPPKGRLVKKLLEKDITDYCVDYGAMEVETPIMYDFEHPTLKKYLNRFPARQYVVKSDEKEFFLRFAACFGQFLLKHDMVMSYKNLPLKMVELTRYSFRREQTGELSGLKRLRAFTMPDMHALCADLEGARKEFGEQFDKCFDWLTALGLPFEAGFRVQTSFFEENKDFYLRMVKRLGKPVLLELFDERYAYFITKFEFNFVDAMNKASALSTVQIDVENADTYDLWFTAEDGSKKRPVILHASLSGSVERVIYALLENEYLKAKRGKKPMLPLWLSPTQVRLVPVSDKHNEYCESLMPSFEGVRVDLDDRNETLGKKVREAEKNWVPFVAVIGDKEKESGKLAVTMRATGEKKELSPEQLSELVKKECEGRAFEKLSLPARLSKRPVF